MFLFFVCFVFLCDPFLPHINSLATLQLAGCVYPI